MHSNARMMMANGQLPNQMQNPFGMPGGSFFPPAFMAPWMMGMMPPQPTVPGLGVLNPNLPVPQASLPANTDVTFPAVSDWAEHCDADPKRARLGGIGPLREKLADQGYFDIDQLTSDRVSQVDLAGALAIGLGKAGLVIKWADEDMAKVRGGTYFPNAKE
jgi:hypothetical protein